MVDCDFNILSPSEFECFTRDLLQASEKIQIESFADGRDGGIDLRFSFDSTKKCIIQCKRYKQDWNKLKSTLKKEVSKVKTHNPDRYILATTVDLTAANKDEIQSIFSPYIKDTTTDILDKARLKNLLGQHPEILKKYYKLWLGSTFVLETIVHKNVINWSDFELDEIKSDISKYVFNNSFNQAQKMLSEHRYVIISGIPGIGKTTLARMLVYNNLALGYEDLVYVVDDLDNASKVYDKNKKQVFFFDDFLGSNFFDIHQQSTNFENKLIVFIKKIKKSQNSLFIMTTREYILSDAKNYYEKIGINNIEIAKCTIELSHYTESVRAQILYNHLAEANLPIEFIDTLIQDNNYMKLIEHRNFSPRIIETIINKQIWQNIAPNKFVEKVLSFFANPLSIWENAFQNLNTFSRYALLVFATFGNTSFYEEWQEAYINFCKKTNVVGYEDLLWNKTVNILQDCFIKIERDESCTRIIRPYNPSIMDFCISYIGNKDNIQSLPLLLKSVLYPEQLVNIFRSDDGIGQRKITINEKLFSIIDDILPQICNTLKTGKTIQIIQRKETPFFFKFFNLFPSYYNSREGFIEKIYDFNELYDNDIYSMFRFELIRRINWKYVSIQPKDVLFKIAINENLDLYEWKDFVNTITELKLDLNELLEKTPVIPIVEGLLVTDIDNIKDLEGCKEMENQIFNFDNLLPNLNSIYLLDYISEKEKQLRSTNIEDDSDYTDDFEHYHSISRKNNESHIHEIFTSLYENAEE